MREGKGQRRLPPCLHDITLCNMAASKRLAKTHPVMVRLDDYERARLEEIAAAWGVTLSAALRRLIREAKTGAPQG